MSDEPTRREADVLSFIVDYYRDHGMPPILDEIGSALGISSRGVVHGHVTRLVNKGKLSPRMLRGRTAYYPLGTGGFQ